MFFSYDLKASLFVDRSNASLLKASLMPVACPVFRRARKTTAGQLKSFRLIPLDGKLSKADYY